MSPGEVRVPTVYFEDMVVGRLYRTAAVAVTEAEVVGFAERYDPQPFHVDRGAAVRSVFGGLVASGWLTAALTMRLMVAGELNFGSGVIGLGVESLNWPNPVRPGDTLTASVEVLAARASGSKPGYGVVKLRTSTRNQDGATVQVMTSHVLVPRRPAGAA